MDINNLISHYGYAALIIGSMLIGGMISASLYAWFSPPTAADSAPPEDQQCTEQARQGIHRPRPAAEPGHQERQLAAQPLQQPSHQQRDADRRAEEHHLDGRGDQFGEDADFFPALMDWNSSMMALSTADAGTRPSSVRRWSYRRFLPSLPSSFTTSRESSRRTTSNSQNSWGRYSCIPTAPCRTCFPALRNAPDGPDRHPKSPSCSYPW